ncbi:ABC transporter ATP-binding protein [Propionibacterium sp. NM47_B9-13]|uniref:ABC transporter ATPase n=2 Tax=Cutibacterium modestum TaxID=2559073 RepID=A0AAD1KPV5_9ACTN|nr:ABC transporter ATP-binding protein [Cutibacterium modestum]MCP2375975.1 ABC transporter ATP-binding protein [Cutibacterium modestum 28N]MCP2381462.1 ABC transporter ATP-binding protein [Cutibacterium modestum 30N]TGY27277.1 ABC transporter ATP-binding protein [Propionibacterium sp. NM47_B9-13]AOH45139.1 cobalt ABC transporter [Cutibacterium modestum]EFS75220.1 ABC transporter, ATP-binding protein [Cutibacterium modestum HL037PA2]
MIEFKDVGVVVDEYDVEGRHRQVTILNTMSLVLPEQRIAVIGPNGAGKSTLLKLVNGLVAATSGTVVVDGIDPSQDGRAARRHVGYIFTNPMSQLVMSTPVADVELSLRQRIRNRAERHDAAMQILAAQGLEAVAGRSVHALSGGERQLVSLASVLAVEPSIILADEPTTLLDLRNREMVRYAFERLDQQILCCTHDLELAATFDRVLAVEDGRVVDDGEPREVIAGYRARMMLGQGNVAPRRGGQDESR